MNKRQKYLEIRDYIKKWAGVKTSSEMAERFNVSRSYITQAAAEMKISVRLNESIERERKILEALKNKGDKSLAKISSELGVSHCCVYNMAEKLGIWSREKVYQKKEIMTGTHFNEHEMENWLIN